MATQIFHPLPPKPKVSSPGHNAETNHAHIDEQPEASSSTPPKPICSMCKHQYSKYTCPGCSMRTCSVACSSEHKSKTGCTGQRNKAAYVPMNQYTWGKMMDDYVFLEDVGRKIGDWGNEIVRGGYMAGTANSRGGGDARGRGRGALGRGRGRGRGGGGGAGKTKRDVLKMQLEMLDIDMELLPPGMDKRKLNQSTWDPKNQVAWLTIEFKFFKPKDPLAPSSETRPPPFVLMTHRNNIKSTLLNIIRSALQEKGTSKKEHSYPDWVKRLVFPDFDDPEAFANPQCAMEAQIDPLDMRRFNLKANKVHHGLDPTKPLAGLLRHTHFVEYPTIEVWEEFPGTILDPQGKVRPQEEERPLKRPRMSHKAGKLAIAGLLGGYGSEDEEEEGKEEPQNVLAALEDYAESDEEGETTGAKPAEDGGLGFEGDMGDMSDDDVETEVDPAVLLELLRAARGGEGWSVEGEDNVDWGDVDDEDL